MERDRRLTPRHQIALPIRVGDAMGVTRNVSTSGVGLVLSVPLPPGRRVAFTFRFPQIVMGTEVLVGCEGTVIRVQPAENNTFEIALTIDLMKIIPDSSENARPFVR